MPGESLGPSAASGSGSLFGRTVAAALLAVGLAAYGFYLYRHTCFAVGGSDSSGYANAARAILDGRLVVPIEPLERLDLADSWSRVFVPLGMVAAPSPRTMAPFYPVGFPLHVAAAVLLLGRELGPYVVSPLAALLALVLMYLVGRELGLSRWFALGGSLLLAACPVMVFQAIQPMSDIVAVVWSLAAVLTALWSRRRPAWAAAAGLCFGLAVLVRPADVILAVPLLFALRIGRRSLVLFLLGGLPSATIFFAYDAACYGSAFRTGYGLTGHWHGFALSNFPVRFRRYAAWTSQVLTPLVAIGSIAVLFDRKVPRRNRLLLATWFGTYFLLYSFYAPADAWWYTRYLLPGLPALVLAFLLVAQELTAAAATGGRTRRNGVATLVAAVLIIVAGSGFERARKRGVLGLARQQAVFPDACRRAAELLPSRALVVSMEMSGALRYYTNLCPVRWDALEETSFRELRSRAEARGYRLYALVLSHEVHEAAPHVPGPWKLMTEVGQASIWQLGSPGFK